MLFDQRVLLSDNGVISDISVTVGNFKEDTASIPLVAGEDYIYVGSYLPFNHKWFEVSSPNVNVATIMVEIWDGQKWNSVVDIQDTTDLLNSSFADSGIVRFVHDREESWAREQDSFDVIGLENTEIYGMYWSRFSWLQDLSAGTTLQYVGQKFSDDADLYLYYPDLNNASLKTAFATGKTDWNFQAFMAADRLQRDLRKNNSIVTRDQILDYELFNEASVHKTAEIIFYGLGASYKDLRDNAETKYKEALNQGFLNLDLTANGQLSRAERRYRQGFMTR